MTPMIAYYLGMIILFAGFLLLISRLLTHRWRYAAAAAGVSMVLVGLVASSELLSWPKPTKLEILRQYVEEIDIIAARLIEGKGIYILAQLPDEEIPRYYTLPWDQETADALRRGMTDKRGMKMRRPFSWDRSWEHRDEPRLYVPPPEKMPPKAGQPEPELYKHPEFAI